MPDSSAATITGVTETRQFVGGVSLCAKKIEQCIDEGDAFGCAEVINLRQNREGGDGKCSGELRSGKLEVGIPDRNKDRNRDRSQFVGGKRIPALTLENGDQ